jgi:hypothetical protein
MDKILQQEVLLMTRTTFSARQCWQKNEADPDHLSEADQLQEACCNGLLPEMLPEICVADKNIFVWQINENKSCIEIELGEFPETRELRHSIDPYSFFLFQEMN